MSDYVIIDNDTVTVKVNGNYDVVTGLTDNKEMEMALLQKGCSKVIFDFADTTYIDSSVNHQMKRVRNLVGKENFVIAHPAGKVLKALQTAKLDKVFNIRY